MGKNTSGQRAGRTTADILCVGSLTIDIFGATSEIKDNESSTLLNKLSKSFGGRGSNFLMFSRIFGAKTLLVGPVGTDFESTGYAEYLDNAGADTSGLFKCENFLMPSVFTFHVESDSRNFLHSILSDKERTRYNRHALGVVKSADYSALYVTSGNPGLDEQALAASKAALNFFAPAHEISYYKPDALARCLKNTDFLLMNEHEADVAEKKLNCSVKRMPLMFDMKAAVVTMGKKGSIIYTRDGETTVPAYKPSAVVGNAGTGDAYTAALISNYLKTGNLEDSARIASATASFVVEKLGCQSNIPSAEAVLDRMRCQRR